MFQPNKEDLEYLFESAGQNVSVNDDPRRVIITNAELSQHEQRHVHSLQKVSRGDIVTIEDESYLTLTESITKRYGKYKVIVRHTNCDIEKTGEPTKVYLGKDAFGDDVYDYLPGGTIKIPAIVDKKTFTVTDASAIRVPESYIEVTLQDNEQNRGQFEVNEKFSVVEKEWKVVERDFSKKGLLILTCELG